MEVQGKIKKILLIVLILIFTGCSSREKEALERGKLLLDEGKYVEAVGEFDRAIGFHGSKNIRGLEIDILRYRAEAEYMAGEYKAAEHTYKLLMSADEERSEYLDMLAIIYTKLCNTDMDIEIDDAVEMYENSHNLGAKGEVHINAGLAIAHYYEEMYDKNMDTVYLDQTEEYLKKLLDETGRKNAKVLAVYGEHLSKREDYENALTTVEEGITLLDGKNLNKNEEEVLKSLIFSRGACYEYMSNYEKALECFNEYIERYGENEEVAHEVAFLNSRLR